MLRNSPFDRFKFYAADSTGGIMDDDPIVDIDDDDKDDKDDDSGETEEEEEETESSEDETEKTEKDEEEKEPVLARVEFKDIKAKFPTFFKDFPDLKHAFFREQQFSEIFPTVEDARKAAEAENAYAEITAAVVEGDVSKFLNELKSEGDDTVKAFANNFLPAIRASNKDLFFDIVAPEVQQFVKNVYNHGAKNKDENIQNAAKIVHKILFGGAYEDVAGEPALMNGHKGKDEETEKDKQNYFRGKYQSLNSEVTKTCYETLDSEISKGLSDLSKRPGLQKIIAKEVRSKILAEMEKDSIYMGRMNANWKKEERVGFSGAHKNTFTALFLGKARTLIPKIRAEVRKETLGKEDTTKDNGKGATRISGGSDTKRTGTKMTTERAKKENLTTRQVFDD